jgi:prevent-host-death family protein
MARIVPFTDARARLTELLDEVESRHEHVVITRKGRPAAVFVSSEEWGAIDETLGVLQDEQTLDDLRQSAKDVRAGRLLSLDNIGLSSGISELCVTRRAKTRLGALPEPVRQAVVETLLLIEREPDKTGRRLLGVAWARMTGLWAARAGNYRVLYTLERRGVIVRTIQHKSMPFLSQNTRS